MLRIATTVGTSLLENFRETGGPAFNNFLIRIEERPASDYNSFKGEIEQHLKSLSEFIKRDPGSACAEINSCNLIIKKYDDTAVVFLISTDTLSSVIAAEAIASYMQLPEKRISTKFDRTSAVHVIPGLQVNSETVFEAAGLPNLLQALYTEFVKDQEDREAGDRVVNITGGFKGVIPYLTLFAQMRKFPVYYTFEHTDQLIEIPPLPFGFDSAFAEKYGYLLDHLHTINSKAKEELVSAGILDSSSSKTGLGSLLLDYGARQLPVSKNVLGLVIEYKLMEYYMENPFESFPVIERGNYYLAKGADLKSPPRGSEIDLVLKQTKAEIDKTAYIAIECKAIKVLSQRNDKVVKQLKSKLDLMAKFNVTPAEFHYMFYAFTERDTTIELVIKRVKRELLNELNKIIKSKFPDLKTRFFMAMFDLHSTWKNDNPYQSFVNEKLVLNRNFKEIILESKNV